MLRRRSQNASRAPPHDYLLVHPSVPTPRPSPPSVPDPSAVSAFRSPPPDASMDASRSGLPPASSLALPPPDVGFAIMNNPINQSLPPPQPPRHGSDPSFYSWLESKTEEDRRKQEEEKTRQESLRLEQRKIEQSMLRDSLQAGVPPHMIPLIFAGISQGGVPQSVLELTQQYMPQTAPGTRGPATPLLNTAHPPPQRRPPHVRRDSRSIPPNPYAAPPGQQQQQQAGPGPGVLLSQPLPPAGASPTTHTLSRPLMSNNPTDPRPPGAARINPGDPQAPPPSINLSNVQYAPGSSVPSAQHGPSRHDAQPRQSPPSLYFHHWIPPNQSHPSQSGKPPPEPSASSQAPRRSDYHHSPGRKRKSTSSHPPPPLPSTRPPDTFIGQSHSSRPDSPQLAEQSTRSRQHSDGTAQYQAGGPEPERIHTPREMSHARQPSSDKGRERPSDLDQRRVRTSRSESNPQSSYPPSHTRYPSSIETPRDSDPDSSPGPSPTTRIHSTQPPPARPIPGER